MPDTPRFDKLLVLDLDETLVFASEQPLERAPDFRIGPYHVYERPGLKAFLETCLAWFTVGVWTSSSRSYAEALVDRIFPDRDRLAFLFDQDRCTWRQDVESQRGEWIKDIQKLKRRGYAPEKILYVDDTPGKLVRSFGNHIRVTPFTGDPSDTELSALRTYLESLGPVDNVRPIDKRAWRTKVG